MMQIGHINTLQIFARNPSNMALSRPLLPPEIQAIIEKYITIARIVHLHGVRVCVGCLPTDNEIEGHLEDYLWCREHQNTSEFVYFLEKRKQMPQCQNITCKYGKRSFRKVDAILQMWEHTFYTRHAKVYTCAHCWYPFCYKCMEIEVLCCRNYQNHPNWWGAKKICKFCRRNDTCADLPTFPERSTASIIYVVRKYPTTFEKRATYPIPKAFVAPLLKAVFPMSLVLQKQIKKLIVALVHVYLNFRLPQVGIANEYDSPLYCKMYHLERGLFNEVEEYLLFRPAVQVEIGLCVLADYEKVAHRRGEFKEYNRSLRQWEFKHYLKPRAFADESGESDEF